MDGIRDVPIGVAGFSVAIGDDGDVIVEGDDGLNGDACGAVVGVAGLNVNVCDAVAGISGLNGDG